MIDYDKKGGWYTTPISMQPRQSSYSMEELRKQANPVKRVIQMTEDFGYPETPDDLKLWDKGDIFFLIPELGYWYKYRKGEVAREHGSFDNGFPCGLDATDKPLTILEYMRKKPNCFKELNPDDYNDTWYHKWQRGQYEAINQSIKEKELELARLKAAKAELELLYGKPNTPIL